MGRWRTHVETWLAADRDGQDEAADAALGRMFAALPGVEPSPAFVARTVKAAWAARARQRRLAAWAAAAAAVLIVGTAGVVLYTAIDGRTAWLVLTTAASLASSSALWLVSVGVAATGWWATAADAGVAIAAAMARPYSMAALVAVEVVAAAAFVMLHRLLRSDVELRTPRAYCF